jgi:exosortase A
MSASATLSTPRRTTLSALAAIGIGVALMVAIFWPEGRAAVHVWSESTAYGHCYLVLPIAAYLAWDRRDTLRGMVPQPALAPVLLGLPLPFIWLAAERLGIMEGRQLVVIAVLQVLFMAVLGWRLYRALSGALLYLFFLVPFGLFLTPVLQTFTAHFIDLGLNLIGIPHFITDMTIEISAGTFYVAEACAGLRFLIASIAFGVFFALLNYRSPGRRVAFIVASIVIPIIANGFRALGIVVLGNILGSAQAAAADHLIYGWFFFSFVTLMLVLAGLPFREAPALPQRTDRPTPAPRPAVLTRVALPVLVLAAIGPAAALALDQGAEPGRLAGMPALVAPAGCMIRPGSQPSPARVTATLTCGGRTWSIVLQAVSGRSTGATLAEARRELIGPFDAEDSVTSSLPGLPGWQTVLSHSPGLVVASAAWVDGQPAPGGLKQRLVQARDSILGATHDPVVMAISWRTDQPIGDEQSTAAITELSHFLTTQPDLTAVVAAVTTHSSR